MPAPGRKSCSGSSALIRNSMAWPRTSMSAWVMPSGSPAAIRIWVATRSMPVIISVTGCSTWIRQLISMKKKSPVLSTRNSSVPDVLVAGRHHGPHRALREVGPGRLREGRRGRLLEDLLVAALDRAVALAEVDAVAVAVDRDLDLDMAVLVQPLLEVQRVVAEGRLGLASADAEHRFELARRAHHAHAFAPATGRRLDEDRVADPVGLAQRVQVVAEHPLGTGDRRQPVGAEQLPGAGLAGEPLEDVGRRPDEREVMGRNDLGEALVLATGSRSRGGSRRSR